MAKTKRNYINADDALNAGLNLEVAPYEPKEVVADKDGKYLGLNGTTIDDMHFVGTGQYINNTNWDKMVPGYSVVTNPYMTATPDQIAKRQQASQVSTNRNDMELMGDEDYAQTLVNQKGWADEDALYKDALARGDTEAAEAHRVKRDGYHTAQEELRAGYGYSGGADGSDHLGLMAYTGVYSSDDEGGGGGRGGSGSAGYSGGSYLSKYQARIDALADAILNRDPFSYDKEKDPLYLQYKDTYTRGGQRGMQDTLAQVSARTGGLASSYAESAAQQTYNNYMAQLADKVPELYQLAYSMYMDELGQDRADLSMLQGLDDTAYGRWSDDRNFGYNAYRDQVADRQWQQQFDYNASRDQVADSQWQTQFDYQKAQDALAQQNWQTQWDYQLQQDALAREDALRKLTSGGGSSGSSGSGTDNQSILKTIYGMDSEDEVYDYLVSRGLNITQTENYMNLYSEHKAEMERQSSATVENRSDEDGVTISRLGKVSWSRLAQLVEEGKVKEVYDPDNNSYWYQWVEK